MFPSNGVMTWRPLLSTGSLGMVPPLQRYYGTLRLPAVHLDPFEILHEPIPSCRPWFAPLGRGRPTGGQGVVGSGLPIRIDDGNVGVSQVPWKPWWSLSVLFDPGRIRQAEWTMSKLPDTAPACVHDEGSRRLVLSGLNHTTFDLTVYASQEGVIAPVPGIMRLFWAFSSSNPPESPSQEDSSLANMPDTLEARCRSDGPPAGPQSIGLLPDSRSFLTVSAVA